MHKKKEAIKSEDKVQVGVIVEVQGEQDLTEQVISKVGKTWGSRNLEKDFGGTASEWQCATIKWWWDVKGADLGEKEHERTLLDKFSKDFGN